MNASKFFIAALLLVIVFFSARAEAAPTMAFGYLANKSNDVNYDYLETIFPNSFASSIRNIFLVNIMKPQQIDKILEKDGGRLGKEYKPHEIKGLLDAISADYFIYGSFVILPHDQIKISLNLYSRRLNRIFSFVNVGRMETEIFKLVDRITSIMIDFLGGNNFYMSRTVPRGAKLGILTDIKGDELNYLYYFFLTRGYRVASMQGNTLDNELTAEVIHHFKYMSAGENSYQIVSDPLGAAFLHGTWSNGPYDEKTSHIRKLYRTYDLNYMENKHKSLQKLIAFHDIDYLLIVGFNHERTNAWVRCLDIRTRDLIWMQSNISGSLPDICEKMILRLSTEPTQK